MVNTIIFSIFLIFSSAALLATLALYTRQSLLIAYIIVGVILGPWGLKLIADPVLIQQTGDIGILFLLFLLGLHLQPQNLWHMLHKVTWVAFASSLLFFGLGFGVAYVFGYTQMECSLIGASMMFSSTIIGLKLLPTTVLHHQHTGEVMIGILLMQDLIAIFILLMLHGVSVGKMSWLGIAATFLSLPALLLFAFVFERWVLIKLLAHFDKVREYMFLLSIAWCLSLSELASLVGLSHEVGAFIAGVSIASSRIALYIAESLKPVRDFFLVLFFFSVGASFNIRYFGAIILPAGILAVTMLLLKPYTFQVLLRQVGENNKVAWEVGVRLGQTSEFSLLLIYLATSASLISEEAAYLVQATAIITFIFSSYFVLSRYITPLSMNKRLQQD